MSVIVFQIKTYFRRGDNTSDWGVVCDDGFTDFTAGALCKELAYKRFDTWGNLGRG